MALLPCPPLPCLTSPHLTLPCLTSPHLTLLCPPLYRPAAIGRLLEGILTRNSSSGGAGLPAVRVVNNLDWFGKMSFLGFLRDVGKFARVGTMMAKDSVRGGGGGGSVLLCACVWAVQCHACLALRLSSGSVQAQLRTFSF